MNTIPTLSGVIARVLLELHDVQVVDGAVSDATRRDHIPRVADEIAACIRAEVASDTETAAAFSRWAAVQEARGVVISDRTMAGEAFRAGAAMLAVGDGAPLCHPVVAHALRQYEVDAEHIHRTAMRTGTMFRYKPEGKAAPDVFTAGTRSSVSWPQMTFTETLAGDDGNHEGRDIWTVTVNVRLPEIVKSALQGRLLSDQVEMPGDPGMRIADVVQEDERTVLHLLPPEIED